MQYCFYENYPTNAATVHVCTCRIYVGRIANKTENGKWHGSFADRERALNCAKSTGRRNLRICRICLRGLNTKIEIGDPDRQRWDETKALVDTGAFISSVPASILRSLGVSPIGKRRVRFGKGKVQNMDYAQIRLRFGNQEVTTFALFNQTWNTTLLGAYALAGLFMAVDPVAQQLVPIEEIHV